MTCKYAIFWFVTVLWMSTNLFNFILSRKCSILLLPLLIIVGYLSERYVSYPLPWNIQVVPMATAYIWIGYLIKQNSDAIVNNVRHIHKLTPLLLAFMVLVAVYVMREDITLNMKYNHYGIPIVSLLTSTLAAVAIGILAIYTSRFPLPTKLFVLFGEASMVIMYLHQFLKYYLYNHFLGRDLLNICVGLTFSLIIYIIILKIPIGRKFYLGTI